MELDVDEYQFSSYSGKETTEKENGMLLKIEKSSPKPLFQQIIDEIKTLIDQGSLETDQALPSTRILAKKLGVNRSTVVRAYEELPPKNLDQ